MTDTQRLFIAAELPGEALDALEDLQADLKDRTPDRAVRWVRPEGIHVTLKFLGDVPVSQIPDLHAALDEAVKGHAPFKLRAEGLGAFPTMQRPSVVWVGVEGDIRQLKALRRSVEENVSPLGYPTENRSFTPHLTLGRVQRRAARSDVDTVGELVQGADVGVLASWPVDALGLIRSELKPGGAVYTEIYRAPLPGA